MLFEQVFTPVPLTLPAHASLFTAMYPPTHGVRDNGELLLSSVPTLAEHLHAQEFDTAAFIGSFVLDRRFGLARGFDEYWGDFPLYRYGGVDPATIQFRGDQVEQAAAEWVAHHRSRPFFVFVHFYDLHGPYLLPEPWRQRFRGRLHDGEVAYVDSLVGRPWEQMLSQGLAAHTLLAITSDHGEALGEHGEQNHGFLLYRSTTRVPWIIRFPDGRYAGQKVHGLARLIDVAPTLCSLLGLPIPPSFQGRSLAPEIAGQRRPPLTAYSETVYPYRHFHTAPLRVLRTEQFTFIQAPRSELYDMRSDPAESQNLIQSKRSVAKNLQSELDVLARSIEVRSAAPVSPEVIEKLKSLGYLSAASALRSVPWPASSLPDPKDRISLYRRFQKALESETEGNPGDVASRLETIAARDPALTAVQIEAGLVRQRIHQDALAIRDFRAALGVDPQNTLRSDWPRNARVESLRPSLPSIELWPSMPMISMLC